MVQILLDDCQAERGILMYVKALGRCSNLCCVKHAVKFMCGQSGHYTTYRPITTPYLHVGRVQM